MEVVGPQGKIIAGERRIMFDGVVPAEYLPVSTHTNVILNEEEEPYSLMSARVNVSGSEVDICPILAASVRMSFWTLKPSGIL